MKEPKLLPQYSIQPYDFYLIRTPLLPLHAFNNFKEVHIQQWLKDPIIQEALYVSSPSLHKALNDWVKNGLNSTKEEEKLKLSFLKYLYRMSSRSTPFGLMAGVSFGRFHDHSQVRFPARQQYKRHSRLDMGFLGNFALKLAQKPSLKPQLIYTLNPTLYKVGNQLRYIEYRLQAKGRTHHLVDIEDNEFIQKILTEANKGASMATLAALLVDEEITIEDATMFVEELVDSQLLLSELEPTVTGEEYLFRLIKLLKKYPEEAPSVQLLETIADQLQVIDTQPLGIDIAQLKQIAAYLEKHEIPFEEGQLTQIDLQKPTLQNTLHPEVAKEIAKAIEWLALMKGTVPNAHLTKFKEVFIEKYGQQSIPLTQVLDNEMGIGYPVKSLDESDHTPLVQGLLVGNHKNASYGKQVYVNTWSKYLEQKYYEALHHNKANIDLSEEDLQKIFTRPDDIGLSSSFTFLGSLIAQSPEAIDKGAFQVCFTSAGGASAGKLLGRFCYGDNPLTQALEQVLREEEQDHPEAIFAEVAHLPMARIGNIMQRPTLRNYEIPVMAKASTDEAHTLRLNDLWLAVIDNRLVLYSKKLQKEVIPRLSSAHNYSANAIPIYHFLCDMQTQHTNGIAWLWNTLDDAEWLPRVTLGKVILSKAQWKIAGKDIQAIREAADENKITEMQLLQQKLKLPKKVMAVFYDHKLPLNLADLWSIKILLNLYKAHDQITLEECLFQEDNLIAESNEGKFTNELVIPFRYLRPQEQSNTYQHLFKVFHPTQANTQRTFALGSEWLYVKIYCGTKTADEVLTQMIQPLTEQLLQQAVIDQWFFIRYSDPKPHLRLRFKGTGSFYAQVIAYLNQAIVPFLDAGLITSFQTDTYVRELERYGTHNIEASEKLFYFDSKAVVNVLNIFESEALEDLRWQLALRGIDTMLSDFGLDLPQKRDLLERMKTGFAKEFGLDGKLGKKQLSQKYREVRSDVESVLTTEFDDSHLLYTAFQIFEQRSNDWQTTIAQITAYSQQETYQTLEQLLPSYIHMLVNRMLRSKQRIHEVVLYDFLFQHYRSAIARTKKKNKVKKDETVTQYVVSSD